MICKRKEILVKYIMIYSLMRRKNRKFFRKINRENDFELL